MKKFFSLITLVFIVSANVFSQTQVTVAGSTSANGQYSTLKQAFDAINSNSQTGNTITIAISGSTTETASAALSDKSWSSLKIYPTTTGITISGNISAGPVVFFNGARNVTIDGSVGGNGSTPSMIITNTSTSNSTNTSTIRLATDAKDNTIQYCIIQGSSTATNGGLIYITAASSSGTGNTNNIFKFNNLTSSTAGRPLNVIYSSGTAGKENTGTISYNNIYNFFNAGLASFGINLTANSNNFIIDGNNFYETTTFTPTAKVNYNLIYVGTSTANCTISNNYFGGSAVDHSGTWTKGATANMPNNFTAIFYASSSGTNIIENNTIKGFDFTNNSGATTTYTWTGVSLAGTGDITCQGNTISTIKTNDTSTSTNATYGVFGITGITKTSTTGTVIIKNNTIGSLTNSNDINASSATTTSCNVMGIYYNGASTSGTSLIEGNTISNINNSSALTTGSGMIGIYINSSSAHSLNINGNFITKLSASNNARLFGLRCGPAPSTICTVTNNVISLSPTDNSSTMTGLYHTAASANYYHNTVYIGGSGNGESVALYNNVASGSTFKNNVFVNNRTNNDGTNHLAYKTTLTTTNVLDYNDFYVDSSTGSVLATIGNSTPYTAKAIGDFGDSNSLNINPDFANSGGSVATDFQITTLLNGTAGTDVNTDFSGNNRGSIYQLGAFTPAYWNGTAWNFTPTSTYNAILNGNFSGIGFSCKNLTINAGKQVTLSSGNLSVSGNLLLKSDAVYGTGTFINTEGELTVSGTSTVEQYMADTRNYYVSSPLTSTITSAGYTFYQYVESGTNTDFSINGSNGYWQGLAQGSILNPGRGYIALPNVASSIVSFVGTTLNNSNNVSPITLTKKGALKTGFNLIGNPFSAHYTVTKTQTDAASCDNAIWYRTATWVEDPVTPANSKFVYTFQTCLINANGTFIGSPNGTTNIVPPMQSFWVRTTVDESSFSFNGELSHQSLNPLKAPAKKVLADPDPFVRFEVSNGTISDEAVIYFNSDASNSLDPYDALKMNNNNASVPEIYTLVDGQQTAINGLNSFVLDTEIPIGFMTKTSNVFTLKANEIKNLPDGVKLILKDHTTEFDLTDGNSYNFSSDITNSTDRFSILFRSPSVTTGIAPNDIDNLNVSVYRNTNNQITVNCKDFNYGVKISVYNVVGQKLYEKISITNVSVIDSQLETGIYYIIVNDGIVRTTRKVIIN